MTTDGVRVVYLSATNRGEKLLKWLKNQPCNIVVASTDNAKVVEFGEYDLGLSFLYSHRVPASEFRVPYRWVNFHPAPLPEFAGRNLAYHAIMEGAKQFGAAVHYMDEEFDSGEIIEVARYPIHNDDTAGDLVERSHALLETLFLKYVPKLLSGKIPSDPQCERRYFRKSPIDEFVELSESQGKLVRALTVAPHFFARVSIGGRYYRFVPERIGNVPEPVS